MTEKDGKKWAKEANVKGKEGREKIGRSEQVKMNEEKAPGKEREEG